MTAFAAVAAASDAAAATRSRTQKIDTIAVLLSSLTDDEVAPVVAWLSGKTTQGRLNVGWATAHRAVT